MIRILLLAIGYCLGLIQTGYIYGRMHGIDIRSQGSGNSGATNSLRVLGKKAGLIVFLGDVLKSFLPCIIVKLMFGPTNPDGVIVYMLYVALGVILGHNYPCYLQFKGGKGIASTAGFILAFDGRIAAICLSAFLAAVIPTRYVSLGSLIALTLNMILAIVFRQLGWIEVGAAYFMEYIILLAIITIQAYIRHRANIVRLVHGTENKIGARK